MDSHSLDKLHSFRIEGFSDEFYCNVVTLGIGNEIVMEKHLKILYPKCTRFYGANPFKENAKVCKKVVADAISGNCL